MPAPAPHRRRVVGILGAVGIVGATGGLGALLASCTGGSGSDADPTGSPSASASPPPRTEAAQVERDLVRRTQDVIARYPSTTALLTPVRDAHARHVEALVGTPVPEVTANATASAPADGRIAGTESAALLQLARAERAAARSHVAGALAAEAGDARLLASVAAYASAQDLLLGREAA